jgi:hypothetical protein
MTVIRTSVIALTVASGGGRAGGCAIGGGLGDGRGEQVVPDQAQSLQSQLTALKDKFGKGEYEAVVTTWVAGRESSPLTRGGGATSSDNGGRFMLCAMRSSPPPRASRSRRAGAPARRQRKK